MSKIKDVSPFAGRVDWNWWGCIFPENNQCLSLCGESGLKYPLHRFPAFFHCVSPFAGRVDWNHRMFVEDIVGISLSLCGESGLKLYSEALIWNTFEVSPFAGRVDWNFLKSKPEVEANTSLPLRGEWIEIMMDKEKEAQREGLSLCGESGLKCCPCSPLQKLNSVSPFAGRVDWNPVISKEVAAKIGLSLCGESGLKCFMLHLFLNILRLSLCGESGLKSIHSLRVSCNFLSLRIGAW